MQPQRTNQINVASCHHCKRTKIVLRNLRERHHQSSGSTKVEDENSINQTPSISYPIEKSICETKGKRQCHFTTACAHFVNVILLQLSSHHAGRLSCTDRNSQKQNFFLTYHQKRQSVTSSFGRIESKTLLLIRLYYCTHNHPPPNNGIHRLATKTCGYR